jgi:hypothetical protein
MLTLGGCRASGSVPTDSPREVLQQLKVISRPAADPTYRRAAFGRAWADVDGDGCNTRDQVLYGTLEQGRPYRVRRQGRCPSDMVAGTWTDLYTQREMTWTDLKDPAQAERLPLDHILSLAAAWRYGARNWTSEDRLRFANDPLELTPTTEEVNRSKSDHDPGDWTPPQHGRCAYATRYVAVKARYKLPVDQPEKTALESLLSTCPD